MLNNIVGNLKQCGQQNMFMAVFISPEQVVHFLPCRRVHLHVDETIPLPLPR